MDLLAGFDPCATRLGSGDPLVYAPARYPTDAPVSSHLPMVSCHHFVAPATSSGSFTMNSHTLTQPEQSGPARRVVSNVEHSLTQRVAHRQAGHHQVEDA